MPELRFAAPKERRVAVVTGGARGIGGATAVRLAEAGRDVVIVDVLPEEAAETLAQITALGQRALFIPTDVGDQAAVQAMAARTVAEFGRLDILVCCAGVFGKETPYAEVEAVFFERILRINVLGVHFAHQACLPYMLKQGWGRCVTITSAARLGALNNVPYGVSKGAVWSFVMALGNAYPERNVFVNGVEPGRALTQMVIPASRKNTWIIPACPSAATRMPTKWPR